MYKKKLFKTPEKANSSDFYEFSNYLQVKPITINYLDTWKKEGEKKKRYLQSTKKQIKQQEKQFSSYFQFSFSSGTHSFPILRCKIAKSIQNCRNNRGNLWYPTLKRLFSTHTHTYIYKALEEKENSIVNQFIAESVRSSDENFNIESVTDVAEYLIIAVKFL